MRTVVRNSYTPKAGDYCNTIVIDKETNNQYLFDGDGVWTKLPADIDAEALVEQAFELSKAYIDQIAETIPTAVSQLENDSGFVTALTSSLVNYYTKALIDNKVSDLQSQIDAISSASDVVDVVGTYAQLQAYDTSRLSDNDIIKVLVDETHDDAISYYRWDDANNTFVYVGSQGPFYTKSESDSRFVPQTRTINGKALSSNITLTPSDIGVAESYDASWLLSYIDSAAPASDVAALVAAIGDNNRMFVAIPGDGDEVYEVVSASISSGSNDIALTLELSTVEGSGSSAYPIHNVARFYVDGTTRVVTLETATFDPATKADYGFYGVISGTATAPTDVTTLANGVYKSDDTKANSYVSLPMEDGTTKRQTLPRGAIAIKTVSRFIVLGTQNLMYQYDSGNQYYYQPDPFIEATIRREAQEGDVSLGQVGSPNVYLVTDPVVSLSATLTTADNQHTRITFTTDSNAQPEDFYLDIDHLDGDPILWQDGEAPTLMPGETWIFEVNGHNIETLRFTDTPTSDTVAWADITGKPTNVSYWTNDAGYITSAALPTATSDLTNDSGFITNTVNNLTNYYTQSEINGMFNSLSIPTKTSDLTNDSGFITDTDYATTSTAGTVIVGSGLAINNGVLSATGGGGTASRYNASWVLNSQTATQAQYDALSAAIAAGDMIYGVSSTGLEMPVNMTFDDGTEIGVQFAGVENPSSDNVSVGIIQATIDGTTKAITLDVKGGTIPTATSQLTNDSGFITSAAVPTKTSDLTNDSGFITSAALSNYYTKSETYSQAEVNGLFNGLSTVASTGDYDDLTDKPQITYTGSTVNNRVVTQATVTEPVQSTKPIGSYGPFNYIPLDMSSYNGNAANKALLPETHLPTGAYVVTVPGYMRLGNESKQLQAGHIIFWDTDSGELDLIGYNACEYWGYDSTNDTWEGGYFTTSADVEYMIDEKMPKWVKVSSGAFVVANKDPGYYTFNYSSASGTTRRITIDVEGTRTYYFPYNDTVLIKSENGVMMLGRYNLWFEYDSTNSYYKQPVPIAQAFTGTDGVNAGTAGLVPAPATTDADKFLKSDGTWATVGGGGATAEYVNDYLTLDTTTGQYTITQANAEALRDLVIAGTPLYMKADGYYNTAFDVDNAIAPVKAVQNSNTNGGYVQLEAKFGVEQLTFYFNISAINTTATLSVGIIDKGRQYPQFLFSTAAGGGGTIDISADPSASRYLYEYTLNGARGWMHDSEAWVLDLDGAGLPVSGYAHAPITQVGTVSTTGGVYNYATVTLGDSNYTAKWSLSGTTLTVLPLETESVLPDNLVYSDTGTATTPTPWIHTDDIQDDAVTADKIDFTGMYASATPLANDTSLSANTETSLQTLTLDPGKWLIMWEVRWFAGSSATQSMTVNLKTGAASLQSLRNNAPVYSSDSTNRGIVVGQYEATLSAQTTFTTTGNSTVASTVSATTTYLRAIRIG